GERLVPCLIVEPGRRVDRVIADRLSLRQRLPQQLVEQVGGGTTGVDFGPQLRELCRLPLVSVGEFLACGFVLAAEAIVLALAKSVGSVASIGTQLVDRSLRG